MNAILSFLPIFSRFKGHMFVALTLSLVTLSAGIALLGISGWFLTAAALSTAGAAFNLFGPSAGVRGLSFLRILSRYGEKLSGHDATLRLLSDLRTWLFGKLFPLAPLGRRFGRGDLVSRLLADVDALDTLFLMALGPISTALIAGSGMTVLLAVFLPGAALTFGLSFFAAALLVPVLLITASRRAAADAAEATGALRSAVLDGIEGHQDLVLFGEAGAAAASISDKARRLATPRIRLSSYGAVAGATVQALMGVALLGTLAAGIAAVRAGSIDGPLLAGLLLAVVASFESTAMLVRSSTRLAGSAAAARRLRDIADARAAVVPTATATELPQEFDLRFEHVRFGYDPNHPVLAELDLTIRAGEHIAITGPSGSGKSTIAHLLLRLIEPQRGTIRFGGVDVGQVSTDDLYRRIALMTQDAPVFLDSIRANLLIGRQDASDDELWIALQAVRLATFVRDLPRQLGTVVGEAGKTLSAGQARRLCLARTLLSRAEIVVLDEPTNGLDRETEAAFLSDVPTLLLGRTALVITHAELPAGFDRIVTLSAGRLDETTAA